MTRANLILLALSITGACARYAVGDVAVYTDRDSFETAIGPHITYTFETDDGFPVAPASLASYGPFTANGIFGDPANIVNYPVGSDNQVLYGGAATGPSLAALFLTFTTPQFAVGFDDFPTYPGLVDVTYLNANGDTYYERYSLPDPSALNASVFFGVTSVDAKGAGAWNSCRPYRVGALFHALSAGARHYCGEPRAVEEIPRPPQGYSGAGGRSR